VAVEAPAAEAVVEERPPRLRSGSGREAVAKKGAGGREA
jgi:hypothetical protein